jgi:hypothetical protein
MLSWELFSTEPEDNNKIAANEVSPNRFRMPLIFPEEGIQ